MEEVVIVAAARTPIGGFGKSLGAVSAHELGSLVIKAVLERSDVSPSEVDEVIMGHALQAGAGQNPARQAAKKAGLPDSTTAYSVNMLCGSGLKSVHLAAQAIKTGDAKVVIAGGQESMSKTGHLIPNSRTGYRMGDTTIVDTMIKDGLWDAFNDYHMGITAENVADKHGLSRQEQDVFAAESQQKAQRAISAGIFVEEIVPVPLPGGKLFENDEHPKFDTTPEGLAKLKPAFKKEGGTVTSGNASGINDGAAALLLMSRREADYRGLASFATIKASASVGIDPSIMGLGPVAAIRECLRKAGWNQNDVDLYELNEAFAAQSLGVIRELGLDTSKVNVNGGAIALGHPIGCSGARVLVTLVHEMRRRKVQKGVAALCVGGGMGIAMAVEATGRTGSLAEDLAQKGLSCSDDIVALVDKVHIRPASEQDRIWNELRTKDLSYNVFETIYHRLFHSRDHTHSEDKDGPPIVWQPTQEVIESSNINKLFNISGTKNMEDLHSWSLKHMTEFWEAYIKDHIVFQKPYSAILDSTTGAEHPVWLPGAQYNIVQSCFQGDLNRQAIIYTSEASPIIQSITYAELQASVFQVANGLRKFGFGKDEGTNHIGIFMPMTPESVAIYLGIIAAGLAPVSIADSYAAPEIATRLRLSQCKTIFTVEAFMRGGKRIDLLQKAIDGGAERIIVLPMDPKVKPPLRDSDILWSDLLEAGNGPFEYYLSGAYHNTNILFSSGTTGDPKVIPWTQLTPIKAAADGYWHLDIKSGDVVCWPTNIGWMMGPWSIYAAFINGASLALYVGAPVGNALGKFIQDAKVTMMGVVPAMVKNWKATKCMENLNWESIRVFASTGERSDMDYLYLMWLNRFRAPICEYCGGTEVGGGYITGAVVRPAAVSTFSTPALGVGVVIMTEQGKMADINEEGEVFLVPPSIGLSQTLLGSDHHKVYYDNCPPSPIPGTILRRHGDQMRRLANGFYQSQGRADNTMNLGGIKVSSADLERVINNHSEVSESAAIAVHPKGGGADLLVVFLVRTAESKLATNALMKELQQLISTELNPLFRIYDLREIAALPKTASNKTLHRELRASYKWE